MMYMIYRISATALRLRQAVRPIYMSWEKELDLLCHRDRLLPELLMLEPNKNKSKWECCIGWEGSTGGGLYMRYSAAVAERERILDCNASLCLLLLNGS